MSYCGGYCWLPDCANEKPTISPNDIASLQTTYGRRIPGQLVSPQGDCAASPAYYPGAGADYLTAAGTDVFLWDCDEFEDDQEFSFEQSTGLLKIPTTDTSHPAFCLTAGVGNVAYMYPTCSGFTLQQWRFESVALRGWGGLCLDVQNGIGAGGVVQSGQPLQLYECGAAGGVNQRWTLTTGRQIKFGSNSSTYCLTAHSLARYTIEPCNGSTTQTFTLLSSGQIKNDSTGRCLDAAGPNSTQYSPPDGGFGIGLPGNLTPINDYYCSPNQLNQQFNASGAIHLAFNDVCLERNGGSSDNGTQLQLGNCDGGVAQTWDYYFKEW